MTKWFIALSFSHDCFPLEHVSDFIIAAANKQMGVGESGRQHLLLILQRVIYIIHNEVGHTKSHITNIDKKKSKNFKNSEARWIWYKVNRNGKEYQTPSIKFDQQLTCSQQVWFKVLIYVTFKTWWLSQSSPISNHKTMEPQKLKKKSQSFHLRHTTNKS